MVTFRLVTLASILGALTTSNATELQWEPVPGIDTLKATVVPPPSGAPVVSKGDTITVHATGEHGSLKI